MKKRIAAVTVVASLLGTAALHSWTQSASVPTDSRAVGYLNLHKRHPDGLDGPVEFARYSADTALRRLDQMREFLASFSTLTERARDLIAPEQLRDVGNTEPTMQTVGFRNIPLEIEGVLLKQEYQLRQVEYELAQARRALRQVGPDTVVRSRDEYAKATRRFQEFWDTALPTD
jgi:hypothetical protein